MGGSFARMCMPDCPPMPTSFYVSLVLIAVVGISIAFYFRPRG